MSSSIWTHASISLYIEWCLQLNYWCCGAYFCLAFHIFSLSSIRGFLSPPFETLLPCFLHLQCAIRCLFWKCEYCYSIHAVYLLVLLFQLSKISVNEGTGSIYTGTEYTGAKGVAGLVADSSQTEVTSNIYGNGGAWCSGGVYVTCTSTRCPNHRRLLSTRCTKKLGQSQL